MLVGFPTTVAPGEHDEMLLGPMVIDDGTGNGALFSADQAVAGYGDTWWVFVGDLIPQKIIYLAEGASVEPTTVMYDPKRTNHTVGLEPLGGWSNYDGIDVTISQQSFESDKGADFVVGFDAVFSTPESYENAPIASHQLTSWTLTGFERFATSEQVSRFSTRAKAEVTLTNLAGVRTVTVSVNGVTICSGSRTGDGVCTLTAQNDSGVNGSVTIAYTADIPLSVGAYVLGRWAASYVVSGGGKSVTVFDDGRGSRLSGLLSGMAVGNQTVTITPLSDTGKVGTAFTAGTVLVPGPPAPPGLLNVVAGGTWSSTQIQFQASTTGSATYNLYDSALDGPTAVAVAATHVAGSGVITWTLPSLAATGTGKRRIIVTAMNGGVEAGVRRYLTIEYVGGNVVLPRPNTPDFRWRVPNIVTSGRTLNMEYTYSSAGQEGVATQLFAYLVAEGMANPYTTPDNTIALSNPSKGVYTGNFTLTAPADGFYSVLVRAATAAGVVSDNVLLTDSILVSNAAPGNPANPTITPVI